MHISSASGRRALKAFDNMRKQKRKQNGCRTKEGAYTDIKSQKI